jgi:CubicO group peptidase (beta-lactamase class C family)
VAVEPDLSGFATVSEIVQGFVDEGGLNGATLIVVDRDLGVLHQGHFGEFGPGRISLVANLSEVTSAGVLMRLHDDGLLDVDAPVADVVAWGSGNPEVTPAQLLSHSSGMLGGQESQFYGPYVCSMMYAGSLQACGETIFTTPDDDADLVPPDTEFLWPGTGADLQVAGAVAEAASGKTWAELVDEIYVQPCGLEALAYNNPWMQLAFDPATFGYPTEFGGDPSTLAATENPSILGGAYATAEDYAALLLMHLREGMCGDERVLSPESLDLMHEDRVARVYDGGQTDPDTGITWGYGMGWYTERETGAGLITNLSIFGSAVGLNMDTGYGAVLLLEATWVDGQALFNDSLFLDSMQEAVLLARG